MGSAASRRFRGLIRRLPFPERLWSWVKRLLQLDDPPAKVARGVSLGLIVALTPTVGIQMGIVLVVHTLCRANRLAGIAMVWISNPVTVVPIYWCDYLVGRWLLGTPPISYARFQQIFDLQATGAIAQMRELSQNLAPMIPEVAVPMALGGLVIGVALAIPAYPITFKLVELERRGRAHLAARREERSRRQDLRTAIHTGERAALGVEATASELDEPAERADPADPAEPTERVRVTIPPDEPAV